MSSKEHESLGQEDLAGLFLSTAQLTEHPDLAVTEPSLSRLSERSVSGQ